MRSLLNQIKARRLDLGLKQHDMVLRIGVSRQQYQRLEAKGNPRLDTLELVAKGLQSELLLVPEDKLVDVLALIADPTSPSADEQTNTEPATDNNLKTASVDSKNPWGDLLGDDE